MQGDTSGGRATHRLITDGQGHYLVWAIDRSAPPRWNETNHHGTRDELTAYVAARYEKAELERSRLGQQAADTTWCDID